MTCVVLGTTVGGLVARAARLLNDLSDDGSADYTRWSKTTLIDYANEGITQISAHRPEALSSQVVLTLKPGNVQNAGAGVDLVSIDNNVSVDTDGTLLGGDSIAVQGMAFSTALNGKRTCSPSPAACGGDGATKAYVATSAALHPSVPGSFEIYPAVPPGTTPQVLATVAGQAKPITAAGWDKPIGIQAKFEAAVVEWMLFRAQSGDQESVSAARASQQAFSNFYQILGVQLTRRSQFNTDVANGVVSPRAPATNYTQLQNHR